MILEPCTTKVLLRSYTRQVLQGFTQKTSRYNRPVFKVLHDRLAFLAFPANLARVRGY